MNFKLFRTLLLVAVPGVIAVIFMLPNLMKNLPATPLPVPVLMALSTIQTSVMVTLLALLGTWLAPKVGFGAPALEARTEGRNFVPILRGQIGISLVAGVAIGALTIALEALVFRPYVPAQMYMLGARESLGELAISLLYGGIVEEIMLRWAFMTLIAWALSFVFRKREPGALHAVALWGAILLSAILFGLGHLGAVKALVGTVTTPLLVRTVVLNALPGTVFGYLYARKGLESAMFAHMGAHIGFFVLRFIFGA